MQDQKQYTKQELEEILTPKQKDWCFNYVVDWNATKAALKAGYSENSAKDSGYQNTKKYELQCYIDFIKDDYETLCGISKLKQINEYKKIAYSSIAHLHNTWIELKEFESLTDEQKECIESIDTKTEQIKLGDSETGMKEIKYVKIKLYSKLTALERIDKLMGYNEPDKHDLRLNTPIKGITFDE